jgi:signal peptidase I
VRKRNLVILFILGLAGVAMLVGYFVLIRLSFIPTGGMANTVLPGDRIVSIRSLGAIERGQIVLFRYPDDSASFLGRVVGLPGESIQVHERAVYVDGQPLPEQKVLVETDDGGYNPLKIRSTEGSGPYSVFYEENELEPHPEMMFGVHEPYRIPAGHYFVIGDNRDNSHDSRFRGSVPGELIWGTAWMIYFSTDMETGEARFGRTFQRLQ